MPNFHPDPATLRDDDEDLTAENADNNTSRLMKSDSEVVDEPMDPETW